MNKKIFMRKKAVEDLPLRLIIIVIILAITLPIIFELFKTYDQSSTVNGAKQNASLISTYVQEVYSSGLNSSLDFKINFKSGFFTKITKVVIGDSFTGSDVSVIALYFSDISPYYFVIQNPSVIVSTFCSGKWQSLTIGPGSYTIHIVTESIPPSSTKYVGGTFVNITVVSPAITGC
ncbi:MAG: hypothetical protein M1481_05385 [Candidatus Thermoplasmatota archaeon]|jgi:hypothetical protein|nr:hypothetical protein [Candidatus Thermoplasmatota archaeon]MCL5963645.1 hypothetical protein [Candidatus Thermoplasmatota archaeon]